MNFKIRFHLLFWLVAFFSVITGFFKEYLIFTSIIFFHELGHILAGLILKWKIEEIIFFPFGGLTKFKEIINKPLKEELLIAIFGPIFQIIYFITLNNFINNDTLLKYHIAILFFNLIPVFPLDGYKIINIFNNYLFSFKTSHILSLILSIVSIFTFYIFFYDYSFMIYLIIIFLIFDNLTEIRKHSLIFNKFLFERYLYKIKFKKRKIIKGNKVHKMKRDNLHLFKIENKTVTEQEILKKKFDLS